MVLRLNRGHERPTRQQTGLLPAGFLCSPEVEGSEQHCRWIILEVA